MTITVVGPEPDVTITNHGTICLIEPRNDAAADWLELNLQEGPRWGRSYAVEPRYVQPIIDGLESDGFEV